MRFIALGVVASGLRMGRWSGGDRAGRWEEGPLPQIAVRQRL